MERMKRIAAMIVMVVVGTFALIWAVVSLQDPIHPETPTWDGKIDILTALEQKKVDLQTTTAVADALDNFARKCSPLVAYWEDIESAQVILSDTLQSTLLDKGWGEQIQLQLKVKDSPNLIPASYRAGMHTCYFDLSLNGNRGLSISKSPCQKLCAMSENEMAANGYAVLNHSVELNKAPQEQHIQKIENQFSAWDGSHMKLEALLKANLNDPKSYEHVKTTYIDYDDHLFVIMSYRAKNGFGALTFGEVRAEVDMDGNIQKIISTN
jgi:hypothetical protein